MQTVQIYDTTDGVLCFDLRHILSVIGVQTVVCSWAVSRVGGEYDEPFEATGDQAGRLEELAASGRRIKGSHLRELADGTQQVIWGEFQAYPEAGATVPVLVVRAIDSSFYEVATCDPRVLQNLKAAFRNVRQA